MALSHQGAVMALSHQGAVTALSHQGAVTALSHQGAVTALSHQGAVMALSHQGASRPPKHFLHINSGMYVPNSFECIVLSSIPQHSFTTAQLLGPQSGENGVPCYEPIQ